MSTVLPPSSYYPSESSLFLVTCQRDDEPVNENVAPHAGAEVELASGNKTASAKFGLVEEVNVVVVAHAGDEVAFAIENGSAGGPHWSDETASICVRVAEKESASASDKTGCGFC
jgi:hypothetical protein